MFSYLDRNDTKKIDQMFSGVKYLLEEGSEISRLRSKLPNKKYTVDPSTPLRYAQDDSWLK